MPRAGLETIYKSMTKFSILIILILAFTLYILHFTPYNKPAFAQCLQQSPYPRVQNGLISTPSFSGTNKFGNLSGQCVSSNQASFGLYRIPSYDDLKSLYFDQSKSTRKTTLTGAAATQANVESAIITSPIADTDRFIYIDGSLTLNSNFLNTKPTIPVIIFIKNDLTINNNIDFAHTASGGGLVFIVSGNVVISQSVTQIDAVIISSGTIYTAGTGCATNSILTTSPLTIYGSLVSLNQSLTAPIHLCRTLADNRQPAEQVIQQYKYLVILRNYIADTIQKWSEIQ